MEHIKKQDKLAQEIFNNATNTPGKAYDIAIRDTVILKKILYKNGEGFYKRVKNYHFKDLNIKYILSVQFFCLLVSSALVSIIYKYWDYQISLVWFGVCAALVVGSGALSGFAVKDLFLQKDFDRLLKNLGKDEDEKEIFINGLKGNNVFVESRFSDKDFELLFKDPFTKEAAIIRDGVMQETKYFIERYLVSVLN